MTLKYRQAIESIENWQLLTDSAIAARLTQKDQTWEDPEWWTCWGIADLLGPENVAPLLERIQLTPFPWVADMAKGKGCPFGDQRINSMLLLSGDLDLIAIAQATRKLISICERFKLPEDQDAIMEDSKQMRVEILQNAKLKVDADRWNRHVVAVKNWNGDPATEPNL